MKLKEVVLGIYFLLKGANAGPCDTFCGFYSGLKTFGGVCSDLTGTPDELALTNCCSFPGVTCNSGGDVVDINLTARDLQGTLTNFVSDFSSLDTLNLSRNALTGPINVHPLPSSLRVLSLKVNQFTGTIEGMTFPNGMEYLILTVNQLSGSIKNSLFPSSLKYLDLSYNLFEGDPPITLDNSANFPNLQELYINDNFNLNGTFASSYPTCNATNTNMCVNADNLCGLKTVCDCKIYKDVYQSLNPPILEPNVEENCCENVNFINRYGVHCSDQKRIEYIHLPGPKAGGQNLANIPAELTGTLHESVTKLNELFFLSLYLNNLTGTVPSAVENMTKLTVFQIFQNKFSGELPQFPINSEFINFAFNQFEGELKSFSSLSKLEFFAVGENKLNGSIPSNIGGAINLKTLDLTKNRFIGEIPDSLYSLVKLERMYIDSNSFTGTLSPSINNLVELQDFYFGENKFNGELPSEISSLIKLRNLIGSKNSFTGSLPDFSNIVDLSQLGFAYNNFSGPFPNLPTQLSYLSLSNNSLSGNVPGSLSSSLTILFLAHNSFSGPFPSLESQADLTHVDLYGNKFNGALPVLGEKQKIININFGSNEFDGPMVNYCQYQSLYHLNLEKNKLSGEIPSCANLDHGLDTFIIGDNMLSSTLPTNIFVTNGRLSIFSIANNQLEGEVPAAFSNIDRMKIFDIHNNRFTGAILPHVNTLIRNASELTKLYINQNRFTGQLDSLPSSNLTEIAFGDNYFTGLLPDFGNQFPKLTYLDFQNNSFSGTLPESIGQLVDLKTLLLNRCKITGSIPSSFFTDLKQLKVMDLSRNQLGGSIAAISLPEIEELNLGYNNITGTILDKLSSLSSLVKLVLTGNKFTGSIPAQFSSSKLQFLIIGDNMFEGTIPDVMNLINLKALNVSYNRLSGPVPNAWGQFPHLSNVSIGHNRFSGEIPNSLLDLIQLKVLTAENCNLTGAVNFATSLSKSIQFLDLSVNNLTGYLDGLGEISNLTFVDLSENKFSGPLPISLNQLKLIEHLWLSSNNFGGSIPDIFDQTPKLKSLLIENANLDGVIPKSLYNCKDLQVIKLSSNRLTGDVVGINSLTKLGVLTLGSNSFTNVPIDVFFGEIPKSLQTLHLFGNQFIGDVPSGFNDTSVYPQLSELLLGNNKLEGFFHGPNLSKCDVSGNQVCDPLSPTTCELESCSDGDKICEIVKALNSTVNCALPEILCDEESQDWYKCDENFKVVSINITNGRFQHQDKEYTINSDAYISSKLYSLQNLKLLDLHGNGINYPLIARVDQMPKLEYIDLSNNRFYGSIPYEYVGLEKLKHLDLSNNKLEFTIPKTFTQLNYLNLSGNTFVGEFSQKFTGFCEIKGSDVCDPAESNPTCGLQSCFKVEFLPKYQKIGNEYKSLLDGFRKVNAALRVFVDDQIYPNNIPPADYAKILLDLLVAYVNIDTAGNINEASRSLDILTIGNIALNLGHLLQDFSDVSGIGVPGGPNGGVLGNGDFSSGGDPQGGSGGFPDGQSDFGLGGGSDFIFINNTLPQNSVTVPVTNGQPKPVNQVPNTNLGSNSNSQNNVNIGSISNTNNNVNIGSNANSINNPIIGPNSNTNTGPNSETDKNSNGVALNIDKNDASKMAGSVVIAGGLGLAMLL